MGDTVSFMLKSATGQILPAMASTLKKGRDYAIDKGVDESVLLSARLFPDMLPLLNQYQMAAETPARAAARIAGLESVGGFGGKAVVLARGELYSGDPAYYRTQLARLGAAFERHYSESDDLQIDVVGEALDEDAWHVLGTQVDATLMAAGLSLAQVYVDAQNASGAVDVLEDANSGPLTLVRANHAATNSQYF